MINSLNRDFYYKTWSDEFLSFFKKDTARNIVFICGKVEKQLLEIIDFTINGCEVEIFAFEPKKKKFKYFKERFSGC